MKRFLTAKTFELHCLTKHAAHMFFSEWLPYVIAYNVQATDCFPPDGLQYVISHFLRFPIVQIAGRYVLMCFIFSYDTESLLVCYKLTHRFPAQSFCSSVTVRLSAYSISSVMSLPYAHFILSVLSSYKIILQWMDNDIIVRPRRSGLTALWSKSHELLGAAQVLIVGVVDIRYLV